MMVGLYRCMSDHTCTLMRTHSTVIQILPIRYADGMPIACQQPSYSTSHFICTEPSLHGSSHTRVIRHLAPPPACQLQPLHPRLLLVSPSHVPCMLLIFLCPQHLPFTPQLTSKSVVLIILLICSSSSHRYRPCVPQNIINPPLTKTTDLISLSPTNLTMSLAGYYVWSPIFELLDSFSWE